MAAAKVEFSRFTPTYAEALAEQNAAPWASELPRLVRRVGEARTYLLMRHHFFGRLAMRLRFVFTERIPTMAITANLVCYINPFFFQRLDLAERAFGIAHEICHVAYLHFDREGPRLSWLWNWATDYMINDILHHSGFKLPVLDARWADLPGYKKLMDQEGLSHRPVLALLDPGYAGESDVRIYDDLLERLDRGEFDEVLDGEPGGFCTRRGDCDFDATDGLPWDPTEPGRLTPAQLRDLILAAARAAGRFGHGSIPGRLARWIDELREPKLPWNRILDRWVSSVLVSGQSYRRPSRSSGALAKAVRSHGSTSRARPILPGGRPTLEPVVIGVDTSGSRDAKDLRDDLSELFAILARYHNPIRVIAWDAAAHFDEYVSSVDQIELIGGGGTSTDALFDAIENGPPSGRRPAAVICFTDGMAHYPPDPPDYPVLWVWTGEGEIPERPPFGEVLSVDDGD